MVFALATDENTLMVFADEKDAISYCEGIDVESGNWLFWGKDGAALQALFITPNFHSRFVVGSGTYNLVPAQSLRPLKDALNDISHIDSNPFFASLSAVQAHLAGIPSISRRGT